MAVTANRTKTAFVNVHALQYAKPLVEHKAGSPCRARRDTEHHLVAIRREMAVFGLQRCRRCWDGEGEAHG